MPCILNASFSGSFLNAVISDPFVSANYTFMYIHPNWWPTHELKAEVSQSLQSSFDIYLNSTVSSSLSATIDNPRKLEAMWCDIGGAV